MIKKLFKQCITCKHKTITISSELDNCLVPSYVEITTCNDCGRIFKRPYTVLEGQIIFYKDK